MDCHKNTSGFFAMTATTTTTANGNGWNTFLCAVTANPLGCGSLWKIKKNNNGNGWIATEFFQNSSQWQTKAKGKLQRWKRHFFMDCHDLRSRNDEKVEKRIYFAMDCHKNTSCFFAMTKSGWIATATSCLAMTATAKTNDNNKDKAANFYGLPQKHFVFSRNDERQRQRQRQNGWKTIRMLSLRTR